ncbi:class I SAM-dependent methyltransferase [Pseudonocardia kongjuensis]|uniref:Class I SAM-dependent methyltransferase n=1 Tax=Pseudonocardia kongjuensis TaxID=102227 RepID=A0ABP4J202_9PSEU
MPEPVRCRACRSDRGEIVLDLGEQPPWDRMPLRDAPLPDPVAPLRMWLCRRCGLAQLADDVPVAEELHGVEPLAFAAQSDRSVARLADAGLVRPGGRVAEFGSPHGESWLPRLTGRGMTALDPADPGAGPADLVVDVYGLLHEPDQRTALRRRAALLAPGGTLALQLLSLGTVLREGQWYDLRHGHHAYWSLPALDAALRGHGIGLHRAWWYPLSGGTLLVTARAGAEPDAGARRLLRAEDGLGVRTAAGLGRLQAAADGTGALHAWLVAERAAGRTVAAYGAASRAVPLVCRAGIRSDLLAAVGDAAPAKQGRRMPGTDVPVVAPAELARLQPDRVVLFMPELADEVRAELPGIEAAGGRWVVLDPAPRLLGRVAAERSAGRSPGAHGGLRLPS